MPQKHFNGLTEAEAEALSLLMEECAEVVQSIGKIQRHGLDSFHPLSGRVNRDDLAREVADVLCAVRIVLREGIVEQRQINAARTAKIRKFRKHPELLHHIDPL